MCKRCPRVGLNFLVMNYNKVPGDVICMLKAVFDNQEMHEWFGWIAVEYWWKFGIAMWITTILTVDSVLFRCPVHSPPCGSTSRNTLVSEKLCICHPREPSFGLMPYFSWVAAAATSRVPVLEGAYIVHHPFQPLLPILLELAFWKRGITSMLGFRPREGV